MVGQPALEVLARLLAELRLAVGVDVDVDRRPPLGVAAGVGDGVEHGLARRSHVPLVDEQVLTRREREGRLRQHALDARPTAWRRGRCRRSRATSRRGVSGDGQPKRLTSISASRRRNASVSPPGRSWTRTRPGSSPGAGCAARRPARSWRRPGRRTCSSAVDGEAHRALDHLMSLGLAARARAPARGSRAGRPITSNSMRSSVCSADLDNDAQPGHLECGHGAYALSLEIGSPGRHGRDQDYPGASATSAPSRRPTSCATAAAICAATAPGWRSGSRRSTPPSPRCRSTTASCRSCSTSAARTSRS